jgi:ABC-2 type transport system ATP-binding protein
MAAPAVRTRNLTKDYPVGFWRPRPRRALDNLTLEVSAGEVFGLLGPNGAGKTTTLKLLMQLLYPTSGHAEILGRPAGEASVKRRIGYLPENPYFYDHLTAEELLSYFAALFGYSGRSRRQRVELLLDQVGIGPERRLQLRRFSKGMLQRVGLAQALINEPDVVFLDEPMSGLDPLGRRAVRELVLGLRDAGCTVFFSSHILSDAEAICSRVAILVGGRLVSSGFVRELLAFEIRGWELVVANIDPVDAERLAGEATRVTTIGGGHVVLVLPATASPEKLLMELASRGAQPLSLNPVRPTLEDFFVEEVRRSQSTAGTPEAKAQQAGGGAR